MNDPSALPKEKKLTVVFRVEPGCLGPKGKLHAQEFCDLAIQDMEPVDADFVHWEIVPRYDKSLSEMEYQVLGKKMTHDQAARYLALFNKDLDEFEGHLHDHLALLIEGFHGRDW